MEDSGVLAGPGQVRRRQDYAGYWTIPGFDDIKHLYGVISVGDPIYKVEDTPENRLR